MNQNGIMFSLVAVPDEIAGGKKVYRAYVKTNGTSAPSRSTRRSTAPSTRRTRSSTRSATRSTSPSAAKCHISMGSGPIGTKEQVNEKPRSEVTAKEKPEVGEV